LFERTYFLNPAYTVAVEKLMVFALSEAVEEEELWEEEDVYVNLIFLSVLQVALELLGDLVKSLMHDLEVQKNHLLYRDIDLRKKPVGEVAKSYLVGAANAQNFPELLLCLMMEVVFAEIETDQTVVSAILIYFVAACDENVIETFYYALEIFYSFFEIETGLFLTVHGNHVCLIYHHLVYADQKNLEGH